jgi:hypothetical protein
MAVSHLGDTLEVDLHCDNNWKALYVRRSIRINKLSSLSSGIFAGLSSLENLWVAQFAMFFPYISAWLKHDHVPGIWVKMKSSRSRMTCFMAWSTSTPCEYLVLHFAYFSLCTVLNDFNWLSVAETCTRIRFLISTRTFSGTWYHSKYCELSSKLLCTTAVHAINKKSKLTNLLAFPGIWVTLKSAHCQKDSSGILPLFRICRSLSLMSCCFPNWSNLLILSLPKSRMMPLMDSNSYLPKKLFLSLPLTASIEWSSGMPACSPLFRGYPLHAWSGQWWPCSEEDRANAKVSLPVVK